MNISWHGISCFEIVSKNESGEVTLVVDPYDNSTGLRFPRTLVAEVVAMSHDEADANNIAGVGGSPFVIVHPGEYEVRGVFIYGLAITLSQMILRIESEGITLAHLGGLNRTLTDEELRGLNNIDILMVPVGGGRVLSPKAAVEVIAQIEPRVVIPMTHAIPNVKEKLATIDEFCKAMGVCRREEATKYKVVRKDLPDDEMLIVALNRA